MNADKFRGFSLSLLRQLTFRSTFPSQYLYNVATAGVQRRDSVTTIIVQEAFAGMSSNKQFGFISEIHDI